MIERILHSIFRINLGVRKHESVLVFTDIIPHHKILESTDRERREKLRDISLLTAETAKGFCKKILFHEYSSTESHGVEPPEELWKIAFGVKSVKEMKTQDLLTPVLRKKTSAEDIQKIKKIIHKHRKDAVNAVIALSNFSTSHTRFRDFLTNICKTRYASMPLFDTSMLEGPMNVDWKRLAQFTKKIAKELDKSEFVHVSTANGTSLSFSKKGRRAFADTGILTSPGAFGNLPAGEVYLAPLEGTANGTLILEWAPTRKLKAPVILNIKDGLVTEVTGKDEYADVLMQKISEKKENANIAEFGLGTNEMAARPDNILESEKILGTIHIALGDNSSFGGNISTPFHQDFVFFKPTVTLIHKDGNRGILMKGGRFINAE